MSYELTKLIEELSRIADGGESYVGGRHAVIFLSQEQAHSLREELRRMMSAP